MNGTDADLLLLVHGTSHVLIAEPKGRSFQARRETAKRVGVSNRRPVLSYLGATVRERETHASIVCLMEISRTTGFRRANLSDRK
jgi:hypothetical protein